MEIDPPNPAPTARVLDYTEMICPPASVEDQLDPYAAYYPVLQSPINLTFATGPGEYRHCETPAIEDGNGYAANTNRITSRTEGGPAKK